MVEQPHHIASLLTRTEMAAMLNVTPRTLHRWEHLHKGPPSIKVGRTVFYRHQALMAWLQDLEAVYPVATVAKG